MPASTDYWINDRSGDPLLVITGEVDAALTKALPRLLREVRDLVGERRVTIVFDRGGWSPKLFGTMIKDGFDLLTYRKGRCRQLFWGKAGWRVSASWKIILISQGVKRKRSQPATTSSRCREVHIFCGEATKAALGRSSTRAPCTMSRSSRWRWRQRAAQPPILHFLGGPAGVATAAATPCCT